jgi:adenine-specific DNA-methyltransferase
MRYIGSKAGLLDKMKAIVESQCSASKGMENKIFCDIFSGTSVVARFFKNDYRIIANDMLCFPYTVTCAGIENNAVPLFPKLRKAGIEDPIACLDNVLPVSKQNCFIAEHYSPYGKAGRMYLSKENALHIDTIRQKIEIWKNSSLLTDKEYRYLIASLLEGVPFVSNITGTYGAYLKHWDKRALNRFSMVRIPVSSNGKKTGAITKTPMNLLKKSQAIYFTSTPLIIRGNIYRIITSLKPLPATTLLKFLVLPACAHTII